MEASPGPALEWERIRQYFQHAVELEPAERELYLQSACGDDVLLRAEVRALLVEHDRASGLLATGPSPILHSDRFMLSPGDCLAGRFEIIRPLGAGGMGEVYEALDRELGERVALKALRPELIHDRKNRERFKNEILNGRKVTHPNICRIYDLAPDYESERACLAFTMELLDGETLAAYLERQPGKRLSVEEALPLVHQMADGLEALHQQGIVHRDFKPGNVILVRQGERTQVRITDFGLARRTEVPGPALSASTDIIGTPIYMAPEQLTGDRTKVSAATDIYALGLVLYEMVTGTRAYAAETLAENIFQKTQGPPTSPREYIPGLDEKWNSTILRCLETEPEDRPAGPEKVVKVLEGAVELAPPSTLPHRKIVHTGRRFGGQALADPRIRWGSVAAAIAVFLALTVSLLRLPLVEESRDLRVAVLPFTAIGSDPNLQTFADGLVGTITRRLSQFESVNEDLVVMAPSTVIGREVSDAADAAQKLGVNYVVEGDLQASGDRLVLTLSLVDADRGHQLATEVIYGSLDDTLSFQDGAVRGLANMLSLRIQPEHLDSDVGVGQIALGAAQFYTTGLGYLQRSDKTENIENAITQFKRAITEDDRYALAYAGLGDAYWRMHQRTNDPRWLKQAQENCHRAIDLNDHLPEVHISFGQINMGVGKYEEAIANFSTALALDKRNAEALLGLAQVYGRMNRVEDALATYDRAIGLRPADWRMYHQLGIFHHRRRDYQAALVPFQRVVDLTPGSAQAHSNLGVALHASGKPDEAQSEFERSIKIEPRPAALANLAMIHYQSERYIEAAQRYEQAVAMKEHDFSLHGDLAATYEHLGDPRSQQSYERAAGLALKALEINPKREELYSQLAHYYAGANQTAKAEAWLAKAIARRDVATSHEMVVNAFTLCRVGRPSEAFDWLESALDHGYSAEKLAKEVSTSIWMNRLRDDPRTTRLIP